MTQVNFNGILWFGYQIDEERLDFMVLGYNSFYFSRNLVQEQNYA